MSDSVATSLKLVDPLYIPEPDDAEYLAALTYQETIENRPFTTDQSQKREKISERIAEEATKRLLQPLGSGWMVRDANVFKKRNNDGHDLYVIRDGAADRELQISVKGCSYLEMTQFSLPYDTARGAWKFDVLVLVDAGITLDRLGRYPKVSSVRKPHVDFYIFTKEEVIEEARLARQNSRPEVYIFRWWSPRKPGSKQDIHQVRDISRYRNRFETIERMLAAL